MEVVALTLARCKREKTLEDLQEEARKAGGQLILAELWAPGEDAALVLFPTDNKLAVVAAVGTEGANYGVQTTDVIAWLESLDGENPFHIVFCNHELVGGAFVGPVKGAKKLAEREKMMRTAFQFQKSDPGGCRRTLAPASWPRV